MLLCVTSPLARSLRGVRLGAVPRWLVPALVIGHGLVLVGLALGSRSNLDLAGDMLEAFAWGQGWQAGHFKHPPLMAWMAGVWFAMLPRTELAYATLAALTSALGVHGLLRLAQWALPPASRLPLLVAVLLLPSVTTMALRFNANTVLLATWPWIVYFFLRWMKSGRWRDALAFAAAAAAGLLGKYLTAVLLLSLAFAALSHSPWRQRLAAAPAAGAAGLLLILLASHLHWLLLHDLAPLRYAAQATGAAPVSALKQGLEYAVSQAVLALPGLAVLLWSTQAAPERNRALLDLAWPGRDPVWWVLVGPVFLTALGTVLLGVRTSSVWTLAGPMLLVAYFSWRLHIRQAQPVWRRPLLGLLLSVWGLALLAAPMAWQIQAQRLAPAVTEPRAELARAADMAWRERFGHPLRWVTGSPAQAAAVAFYGPSGARWWSHHEPELRSPWVDLAQVRRDGGLVVCTPDDAPCNKRAVAQGVPVQVLEAAKQARGQRFGQRSIHVYMVPPA